MEVAAKVRYTATSSQRWPTLPEGLSRIVTQPLEVVPFKVLYLGSIWEGEAPAELLRLGSAGASPSRPMNLQVPKPDDLTGRVN